MGSFAKAFTVLILDIASSETYPISAFTSCKTFDRSLTLNPKYIAKKTIGITPARVINVSFHEIINRMAKDIIIVIIALINIEILILRPS